MSDQPSISKKTEMNPRTARTVAAILSQNATDEALRVLNNSDGRNQSEQASHLAAESPFLREIYERGGTVVDGVLTVPRENLTALPEIEITTQRAAVEKLTAITKDAEKAKELAPQLVEMGASIAGSNADGETRLKVFGWLYRALEGKQELLSNDSAEKAELNLQAHSEAQFSEKWQQIVELSEAMAALEPKDRLPENSVETIGESLQGTEMAFEQDESLTAATIYENSVETDGAERAEEMVSGGALIGFERIEIGTDLPEIPENLSRSDFEKLLEKTASIDSDLERGIAVSEILAPFKRYVETARLDNELRLVEEEYVKGQAKIIGGESGAAQKYRFVAKREELRELDEDIERLATLEEQKVKITEKVQTNFGENVDRKKVERTMGNRNNVEGGNNRIDGSQSQKIELTEDETELRELLIRDKSFEREINGLSESIGERERGFRRFSELSTVEIPAERQKELIEKVVALELPVPSVLKEKYPESTAQERNEKLTKANTFEIRTPAEYLFTREAANKHFQILRAREIKKEYQRFESTKAANTLDISATRRAADEHREKIKTLQIIEPVFSYKIEGSNRILSAKPSERAVAGYKFASEYVRYQLKQPETRLRFESAVYREYAARLEAAKTAQDVVREAYRIRQENHRAAGIWKNADKEERRNLTRPLSKNEMTLLFLEQPPRGYTAEMSVLKYNFAHHSEAKGRMTAALAEGKLEPSAEAAKLIESLENRLNRRDLATKRKATKHFLESLKTENEMLHIKNEFDHRDFYQNLPPHEKDWIYSRASKQKENLEYKIAYDQAKSVRRDVLSQNQTIKGNDAASDLRQEFAAGTLWHQAALLTGQKETKGHDRGADSADENFKRTIGFLIHNQSEANNLRVAAWLEKQESEELKTAGEILKTFSRATREIENNRMTVTVKVAESNRVSADDYKNLFERYFPADFEKVKDFRVSPNERFRLERSRRDGQTALFKTWEEEAQTAVYRHDAPTSVFEREQHELEAIGKIKAAQIECRRAVEIKNSILLKVEEKLKTEFAKKNQGFSDKDLRAAVELAFAPEKSLTSLPSGQKAIFDRAQEKIPYSDFKQFTESTERLEEGLIEINKSFEKIAAIRLENKSFRIQPQKIQTTDSLRAQYKAIKENAQNEQIAAAAREKFTAINADDKPATLIDYFSIKEREQIRIESHRQAHVALEPAELNETVRNAEIQVKALELADAVENAHQASLRAESESEIAEAFTTAEEKRKQLDEFLKIERNQRLLTENQPITLKIYERELARNERAIMQAKIAQMVETGKLSLADLETKKAGEIFSPKERDEIKLEAGERTRENLEPKELWAKRSGVSEKLQQAALYASENLEKAHEIYHDAGAKPEEIAQAFSALDARIVRLKNERRTARLNTKFINFKTDFKRDLAQIFEGGGKTLENPRMLAAMTKGLLIDGLEKQNISPEKIGVSSEQLSEISRTISMAMVGDKKREPFWDKNSEASRQSKSGEYSRNENPIDRKTEQEKRHVQVKPKQFERVR